jgi:hypothetical protein
MEFILQALLLIAVGSTQWPPIRQFTKTIHVPDAAMAEVVLQLTDIRGDPAYTLSCYGAKAVPPGNDFVYTGDFECRLVEARNARSTYSTLLTEDAQQSRDWESRARFFATELEGACADVPEFGRKRTFLLRGFRLTLTLSELRFTDGHQLQSFVLTISARNDSRPGAQREIASAPTISRRWATGPCKLDNSVKPRFAGR